MSTQSDTVRVHLERIVASPHFAASPRLKKFLRFVVEQTLQGGAVDLKESVIGVEVFERDASYDPRIDPVVRVMAGRVRERLQHYYDTDGNLDEVRIELPKGGYVPHFEWNRPQPPAPPAETVAVISKWRSYLPVASVALALFAGLGLLVSRRTPSPVQLRAEVLTILPGQETWPSLSPDGNLVAFSWPGQKSGPPDIWIKAVRGEALRQLTATPVPEFFPAWSPDGREIAFVRAKQGVFVVSQLGGLERKISDTGILPAWSADSKSVLVRDRQGETPFGIWQIDLETSGKAANHSALLRDW